VRSTLRAIWLLVPDPILSLLPRNHSVDQEPFAEHNTSLVISLVTLLQPMATATSGKTLFDNLENSITLSGFG
jgi:hypothetical protein